VNKVVENFDKTMEEFFTQRINWYAANETESVNDAYMVLRSRVECLREALSEEQLLLLRNCENAYRISVGESERFYYKAGFSDAIRFQHQFDEEK